MASEQDIIARESGGRPYIGTGNIDLAPYLASGDVTPHGFPDWPGIPVTLPGGRRSHSTAAGLYQITKSNWDAYAPAVGVSDFTPQSQKKVYDYMRARFGETPWAASAHSELPAEGFYGGSQHLNLTHPANVDLDPLSMLLATAQASDRPQQPSSTHQADQDAAALLNSFIEPPGKPQASETPAGGMTAPAPAQAIPAPPTPPQSLVGEIPSHLDPLDHLISLVSTQQGTQSPQNQTGLSLAKIEPPSPSQVIPSLPQAPQAPLIGARPGSRPQQGPPPPNEADPLDSLISAAKDIANVPVGLAERAALGAWNTGGALVGLRPTPRTLNAPTDIGPGLQRLGDLGMAAGMPGISTGAAAAPQVARDINTTVPAMLADEAGSVTIPPAVQQGIKDAGAGIEKFFSPSTVDAPARFGSAIIRRETGQARRSTAQAEAQLSRRGTLANPPAANPAEQIKEPWRPLVNRHVPDFKRYIANKQAGQNPPKPALLRFLDYVETRGQGGVYSGPPELQPLADVLRKIYKQREMAIAAEPSTSWAGFVDDYYSHQWVDPNAARHAFGAPRQGSGRNLRQRSIPTISEGIDRGLVPASLDPIETTMTYVANMDRYLAHNRIFRIGRESDMIKFHQLGQQPEGWAPLEGRLADRAVATGGIPEAIGLKAYAPEGFARVYNNAVSTGFLANQLGGPIYTALLHAKNTITQTVLSLSGYHALAMSQETAASAFASAIQGLQEGDAATALKQLGLGAMTGVKAAADTFGKGAKLERQYLGIEDYGPDFEHIVDLYAKAGGRIAGRGAEYQNSAASNYFQSFRRGALRLDLAAGLRQSVSGNPLFAIAAPARFLGREMGRISETITMPVFDKMIPRLKAAAFYDEMSGWIKAHPTSTAGEQLRQARGIADTIDDRFGEMVMDNIFWGKATKQTLQLLATSLGWELGSIRSLGGAPLDALRGQFSPRVRYAVGLGMAVMLENAAYQYLKTGKTPGQDIGGVMSPGGALDLAFPRTGGQTPEGNRERALLPGFEKDVIGYWDDAGGELANKVSPFARLGIETYTGRDWRGSVIAPFPKYTPDWFKAWARHVEGSMTPIPLAQERYRGSNIGTAERVAGARPASERYQNPDRVDRVQTMGRIYELRSQLRGLYAHGVRTTEEKRSLDVKAKEIVREIEELNRGLAGRTQSRAPSRPLYRAMPAQAGSN